MIALEIEVLPYFSLKVWALPHPGIGWRARSGEGRQEAGWEWKAHDVGGGRLFFYPLHLIWRLHDLSLANKEHSRASLGVSTYILLQYMAHLRVLRCTQSLGWGPGQGELTGRIWSLQVSLLFLENYIVMRSARPFENQVDVHSVLPCLALTTGAWQRVMPSWSSSRRRLGWFQVDKHIFA